MSKLIDVAEAAADTEESASWVDLARKVLLAGIGAVVLAQEEIDDFVEKLIERGAMAEKDGQRILQDINEKRKGQFRPPAKKEEPPLAERVGGALARMDVPSQADIDALSEKIAQLSARLDDLLGE